LRLQSSVPLEVSKWAFRKWAAVVMSAPRRCAARLPQAFEFNGRDVAHELGLVGRTLRENICSGAPAARIPALRKPGR
jgi:hypothetical protein